MNQINCSNTSFQVYFSPSANLKNQQKQTKTPLKYASRIHKVQIVVSLSSYRQGEDDNIKTVNDYKLTKKNPRLSVSFSISVKQSGHTALISYELNY